MCSTLLPPSLPQLKEDRKRQICFRDLEDGHLMVFNPLNPRKNGDLWVKSHPRSPYDSNAWLRRLSFEKKMQQNILHYCGIVVYFSLVFQSCLMQYKQNEMETHFKPGEVWEQRVPSASLCIWGTPVVQFDFRKMIRTLFSNCLNCMQI